MRDRRAAVSPRRWLRTRRHILLVDAGVAAVVLLAELVLAATLPRFSGVSPTGPAGPGAAMSGAAMSGGVVPLASGTAVLLASAALAVVPLWLRRAAPWAAIGGCVLGVAGAAATGWAPLSLPVVVLVVAYTSAARLTRRPAAVAAVLLWAPVLAAAAAWGRPAALPAAVRAVLTLLVALVAVLLGRAARARRMSARVLRERAAAAEANQRVLAAHAVTDERRRIARELHDVVAHHISVIGVLATGARRVLPRDPAAADEALQTITDTSRTTLREMRRLLDVLRSDSETDTRLTPQPGLAGIEALVEQVREAGLPVRLEVLGTAVPMETGVALTVYRIVQEALTNTMKHAGAATALVRLCFDDGGLRLHVSDTGEGPPAYADTGVGHGLVGMRERVTLYGGTLRTGAVAGGGFAVDATIPGDQLGAGP